MICADVLELAGDRVDLAIELIDQDDARLDVFAPRLGDIQASEQLAPCEAEQI